MKRGNSDCASAECAAVQPTPAKAGFAPLHPDVSVTSLGERTNMRKRQFKPRSFVQRTFALLSDSNIAHIVTWSDDGKSFEVKDVSGFISSVLPKYFRHNNFTSFVRQLNAHSFHKDRGRYCYSHPLFQRGNFSALNDMRRKQPNTARGGLSMKKLSMMVKGLKECMEELLEEIDSLRKTNLSLVAENHRIRTEISQHKAICDRLSHITSVLQSFPAFPCEDDKSYEEFRFEEVL